MTSKELIRLLKADGWYEDHQTGSHIHFIHGQKKGKLIVPFHVSKELGTGLTHKLLKQAGLK